MSQEDFGNLAPDFNAVLVGLIQKWARGYEKWFRLSYFYLNNGDHIDIQAAGKRNKCFSRRNNAWQML